MLGVNYWESSIVSFIPFKNSGCLWWYDAGNFSFTERISAKYAGAAIMYFISKKLKKKYNITDERTALYEAAETWVDALNGRDFLGMF